MFTDTGVLAPPSQLLQEKLLSLGALARERDIHPSTVYRWCTRGANGAVLESCKIGGTKYTSREAFNRWVDRTSTGGSPRVEPASNTNPARQTQINDAERRLRGMGL